MDSKQNNLSLLPIHYLRPPNYSCFFVISLQIISKDYYRNIQNIPPIQKLVCQMVHILFDVFFYRFCSILFMQCFTGSRFISYFENPHIENKNIYNINNTLDKKIIVPNQASVMYVYIYIMKWAIFAIINTGLFFISSSYDCVLININRIDLQFAFPYYLNTINLVYNYFRRLIQFSLWMYCKYISWRFP